MLALGRLVKFTSKKEQKWEKWGKIGHRYFAISHDCFTRGEAEDVRFRIYNSSI